MELCQLHFNSNKDNLKNGAAKIQTVHFSYARTDTFKFSFFNRIVDMWNTLPLHFRQATTIASFKTGVREFLAGNV